MQKPIAFPQGQVWYSPEQLPGCFAAVLLERVPI